jgi:hypothetical protein
VATGAVVVVALVASLLRTDHFSMGIAGVLVSLLSVAAALLIAPPLLLLGGRRVAGAGAANQPVNKRSFW